MDVVTEGATPQTSKAAVPAIETRPARQRTSALMSWYSDAETKRYMQELFQTDFNSLDMLSPESAAIRSKYEEQVNRLIQRTVAEEFQHPAYYTRQTPQGPEILDAEPVLMLRRAAFISRMNEKAGYNRETGTFAKDPAFIFLDLKDIYAANMAGSADWLLSSVAQQLNIIARSYFESIGRLGDYATCRYGGDEFVMGTVGLTPEQNTELQKRIRLAISQMTGFYMQPSTGKIIEKAVMINTEKDNLITLPEDPTEREIFIAYLNRGLILDSEELGKIQAAFTREGVFDRSAFQTATMSHKKDMSYEERLNQLFFGDTDLAITLTYVDYLDRQEEKQARLNGRAIQGRRKRNLIRLLDAVVFDPLLGENVLSFEGMKNQIARGAVSKMVCVDLKYIKEINDRGSMAEGDMAIENLWKALEMHFRSVEKSDFIFARRGGTFLIGLRADAIHPTAEKLLENVSDKLQIQFRGMESLVPLGISAVDVGKPPDGTDAYRRSGSLIGEAVSRAEDSWYGRIKEQIRSNPKLTEIFERVHGRLVQGVELDTAISDIKTELNDNDFHDLNVELLLQYFFGKPGLRRSQRQARILTQLYPPTEKSGTETN